MSSSIGPYTGTWLHHGDWRGEEFSHEFAEYDHDESPGASGSTRMRHAFVDQDGRRLAVWVPAGWSDEEVRAALDSNW